MQESSPLAARLKPGTRLGRYSLLEALGAGGMGVVYQGRDEKLERLVAIKVLSQDLLSDEGARHRFHKEALALAKLNHAHIAAIYDVGEQDGIDYIVMELVPGESLAAKLRRRPKTGPDSDDKARPLSIKEATTICLQIAEALEDAHEQGVVHRDLKPGNVMITPRGQVKVLDFGLAKLLARADPDATLSMAETRGAIGTPLYMSPEQALGKAVDARTDFWSLGCIYYECLTDRSPFQRDNMLGVLRAIADDAPASVRTLRVDAPPEAEQILSRTLVKEPSSRYSSATEIVRDASDLLLRISAAGGDSSRAQCSGGSGVVEKQVKGLRRPIAVASAAALLLAILGAWFYMRLSRTHWALEKAPPQIEALISANKPLAAWLLIKKAQGYEPSDLQLRQLAAENTASVSVTSEPSGAVVEIKDYVTPEAPWHQLGTTPLTDIEMPKGYFRWRISKPGAGEMIVAPATREQMSFPLAAAQSAPKGMVLATGGEWGDFISFVGWVGPYKLPDYYVDRYEVTNRDYQDFVDHGGYDKKRYWQEKFTAGDGRELAWEDAVARFRDTTGRPGPAGWAGGHYPQGQAGYPVSGVSWYEASAYAAYAGKQLPAFAQWFYSAQPDEAAFTVQESNFSGSTLAPVGAYNGIGPYGTYDLAGNVREWVANAVSDNLRFILGGSSRSEPYLYSYPEALSPFDRSEANGFRCVKNVSPLPADAEKPIKRTTRDFSSIKPVPDDVFHAYQLLYNYPQTPLNAKVEGVIADTVDWRQEKITYDAAYNDERMTAYLFLPKNVKPPYQTVLFFPSARVLMLNDSRRLGDMEFFDYIIQSGRAVLYPIYQDTYERRSLHLFPHGSQPGELTEEWYKDAARSLDYLATRPDIDSGRLGYLGVSMGSADGVIVATLLQARLKTAVFLDGGFFLDPQPSGFDQADFVPRMKKPVLMVNGRYDFTFPLDQAQNPFFKMLGTPDADKMHVVFDTPHDVTQQRPQLVKTALDWLDKYMGRVSPN